MNSASFRIYFVCGKLHEVVAPLAGQGEPRWQGQGWRGKPFHEAFRQSSLSVILALVDTRQSDRGYISDKDYKCILIQLLVDDFLAKVLWPSIRYGQDKQLSVCMMSFPSDGCRGIPVVVLHDWNNDQNESGPFQVNLALSISRFNFLRRS